jgi:hypothetical protein
VENFILQIANLYVELVPLCLKMRNVPLPLAQDRLQFNKTRRDEKD